MGQALNGRQLILLLAVFGSLMVGALSFSHMESTLPRLWLLTDTDDDRVAIQFDTEIYLTELNSGNTEKVDLAAFGKNDVLGGFDFFGNGDVLVGLDSIAPDVLDRIKVLGRLSDSREGEGGRLFRCSPSQVRCRLFSNELPPLNRSFRIFVDEPDQRVYLSDTSRHQIFMLDTSGKLLASKQGFRFPNQIAVVEKKLWLADTNHHRLVGFVLSQNGFGPAPEEITTRGKRGRIWPSGFARAGNEWWVLLANNSMKDGVIVRFDNQGNKLGNLQLPPNADPLALTMVGGRVIVSDYRHYRVYQFDLMGNPLDDLKPQLLAAKLDFYRDKQRLYGLGKYACWGLFSIFLITGFVVAIRRQLEQAAVSSTSIDDNEQVGSGDQITPLPITGMLLEPSKTYRLLLVGLAALFPSMGLLTLVILLMTGKDIPLAMQIILGGFPFVLLLPFWPLYKMLRFKLRVFSDRLQLIDHQGNKQSQSFSKILWAESGFLINKTFIPVADPPRKGLFKREEVEIHITPRFYLRNKMARGPMMTMQIKTSLKKVSTWVIAIIMILFLIGAYMLNSGLASY